MKYIASKIVKVDFHSKTISPEICFTEEVVHPPVCVRKCRPLLSRPEPELLPLQAQAPPLNLPQIEPPSFINVYNLFILLSVVQSKNSVCILILFCNYKFFDFTFIFELL